MTNPRLRTVTNFGGEVRFAPKFSYEPKTEGEVLDILGRHKGQSIRAVGSLHSWNTGMECDVLIDMRNLGGIKVGEKGGAPYAEAGGGATLGALVGELKSKGLALPTLGAITRQTISGAASTGTHGSGRHSISHYIDSMRVAAYDRSGEPRIFAWAEADPELLAARCGVGCMGVTLSAGFRPVPEFWVEEKGAFCSGMADALAREKDYPLQQFLLIPYSWKYFSFQRRETEERQNAISRAFWKAFDFVTFELGAHLALKAALFISSVTGSRSVVPAFYDKLVPLALPRHHFINPSADALTLHTSHHYLFRHLEMEAFVPERHMEAAGRLIRSVTSIFADSASGIPEDVAGMLKKAGMLGRVHELAGTYQHHYPFFFRSIHPDDALISMASGEKHYSISFFTYLAPKARAAYYEYAKTIALCLNRLCEARLHWGKYFPLGSGDIGPLYPRLGAFRGLSDSVDMHGSFRNAFTRRALGLE